MIKTSGEIEDLAKTVDDNGGVYFVLPSRVSSLRTGGATPGA